LLVSAPMNLAEKARIISLQQGEKSYEIKNSLHRNRSLPADDIAFKSERASSKRHDGCSPRGGRHDRRFARPACGSASERRWHVEGEHCQTAEEYHREQSSGRGLRQ